MPIDTYIIKKNSIVEKLTVYRVELPKTYKNEPIKNYGQIFSCQLYDILLSIEQLGQVFDSKFLFST